MGLSSGPSLNHASGERPNFGSGAGFLAEAHPCHEPLVLPDLWPRSQPPHTPLGGHPRRGRERTCSEAPSPPTPPVGCSVRGAGPHAPSPARRPPTLLQMAGSCRWFANGQVRLKPQSLWLPVAVISHTVSDPIIATPPRNTPHFICLKGQAHASPNSISAWVYIRKKKEPEVGKGEVGGQGSTGKVLISKPAMADGDRKPCSPPCRCLPTGMG